MAADHIIRAKEAQAQRDQADALMALQAQVAELKDLVERIAHKVGAASEPATQAPAKPKAGK